MTDDNDTEAAVRHQAQALVVQGLRRTIRIRTACWIITAMVCMALLAMNNILVHRLKQQPHVLPVIVIDETSDCPGTSA